MTDKHHHVGRNAHGVEVSGGYYAIAPDGSLRLIPPDAPLKNGWRLAVAADFDAALNAEEANAAADAADEQKINARAAQEKAAAKQARRDLAKELLNEAAALVDFTPKPQPLVAVVPDAPDVTVDSERFTPSEEFAAEDQTSEE